MTFTARLATEADMPGIFAVREAVFCGEQEVPPHLEVDGLDPACQHIALVTQDPVGEVIVGTARLREADGQAKAERVCVASSARGQGGGVLLMRALEQLARERGHSTLHLHAQVQVIPFYEALGYIASGPTFDDAGIDHRAMRRNLLSG